jgi:alpha-L-fucosidase
MMMKFSPDKKSISKHEVPEWFHDAKLGIFIHWGLYSVPAFAHIGLQYPISIDEVGPEEMSKKNPYAEWYLNTLRIADSPTQKYHYETYGADFSYDDFVPMFNEAIKKWDPEEMVDLFKKAGAKYVVLVTKHHDGFLLWHSNHPNPNKKNYMAERDIVEELSKAVRNKDMKMAFYYSGVLDWSFNPNPIKDAASFFTNGLSTPEYTEYANNHWYELIDRYEPTILWNDIGYPPHTNVYKIFAYYLNKISDGVINDRWTQSSPGKTTRPYHDYKTPEYVTYKKIKNKKWECTRGIGNSFGYNKFEKEEDYLTPEELVRMFVDIVSKNGNLLINVGPMADGTIPDIQKNCLLALGKWLEINGEAIFGTRPWQYPEGNTTGNIEIRYTQKPDALYAFLLDKPQETQITIQSLKIRKNAKIKLLGQEKDLEWNQEGENLTILIPENIIEPSVYVFKITPKP